MINCECDNCGKDCLNNYIYCAKCYKSLEQENGDLRDEIEQLNFEISDLERRLTEGS